MKSKTPSGPSSMEDHRLARELPKQQPSLPNQSKSISKTHSFLTNHCNKMFNKCIRGARRPLLPK